MITARIVSPVTNPESVFITAVNKEGAVLQPGYIVEWSLGTNATQPAGAAVELVDAAVNDTTGIGAPVAGVVHTTINTGAVGLLQVYGYDIVRSTSTLASARLVVATTSGVASTGSQSTLTSPEYDGAVVGWVLDSPDLSTQSKVFLKLM